MSRPRKVKVGKQFNINMSCNPGSFTIPIEIGSIHFKKALCDLGASINLMPLSIYEKLGLVDKSVVQPKGVLEDVLVKVRNFIIPMDFVVLDFEEDREIPILLGRPFIATSRSIIDLEKKELTMEINGETETFKCGSHQSDESWRKPGEQCHYIFTFESNYPESRDTLNVINARLKSRPRHPKKEESVSQHGNPVSQHCVQNTRIRESTSMSRHGTSVS
ncbi:Retrovirus-related Pol polyprotein from transposon opus [Gossypium australe]|uniref:Retrovirus-related Pol polyprotein from transposon opus n=1 Tax=Gossypium australe TaxID=47621 RepID=A0A5B6W8J0_9ROSI|nr:Retrovirus-related Pol polyprotein from transposon opus [Gossypium australe]